MKNLAEFLKDWLSFRSVFNNLKESFAAHTAKVEDFIAAHELNTNLQAEKAQLQADLSTARTTIGDLEADVESKDSRISALESELAAAQDGLKKANEEKQALIDNPDKVASRKAANIVADAGADSLPAAEPKADADDSRIKNLKGLEKVTAVFQMKSRN